LFISFLLFKAFPEKGVYFDRPCIDRLNSQKRTRNLDEIHLFRMERGASGIRFFKFVICDLEDRSSLLAGVFSIDRKRVVTFNEIESEGICDGAFPRCTR